MKQRGDPNNAEPDLFTGSYCCQCPAAAVCRYRDTADACSEPSRYEGNEHPTRTPRPTKDFNLPTQTAWKPLPILSPFIPIVDHPLEARMSLLRLRRSLGQKPLQLPPNCGVSLLGSDRELKRLVRQEGRLGPRLQQSGAAFVVAPGFSTWWTHSPYASMLAIAQSAHTAAELARHLPVVPTLVWRRQEDLPRWAAWVHNEQLTTIAVDFGMARRPSHWQRVTTDLAELRRLCGPAIRLLVSGPSQPARIANVIEAWPEVTFISTLPSRTAGGGRLLLANLTAVPAPELTRAELLNLNINAFDDTVRTELAKATHAAAHLAA